MSYNNPFNQSLDWALQAKYARVDSGSKEYEGRDWFQATEPYLNVPTPQIVNEALKETDLS